ncbi:MAG: hypothetical protein ACOYVF_04230 [Candidatus Zixiibacteriota bacterium]
MTESKAPKVSVIFREFSDWRLSMSYTKTIKAEKGMKKYVYVFKQHTWGVSISAEICYDENGKWKLVDWSKGAGARWAKSENPDVREATISQDEFKLEIEPDTLIYVFISQNQLSYKRIQEYLKGNDQYSAERLLRRRAVQFNPEGNAWTTWTFNWRPEDWKPPDSPKLVYIKLPKEMEDQLKARDQKSKADIKKKKKQERVFVKIPPRVYIIYLIDFLGIAHLIQEKYLKAVDENNEFLGNKDESEKRYLGMLTWSVVQKYAEEDDDALDWIKVDGTDGLNTYLNEQNDKILNLKNEVDKWADIKYGWLSHFSYMEMKEDYADVDKFMNDHESDIMEASIQSKAGKEFLEKVVKDETSWENKYLNRPQFFQTIRRDSQVLQNFFRLFSEIAVTKIKVGTETAIELERYVHDVIIRAGTPIKLVELPAGLSEDLVQMRGRDDFSFKVKPEYELGDEMKQLRKMQVRVLDWKEYKKTLEKLGIYTDRIMVAVQTINLAFALNAIRLSDSAWSLSKNSLGLIAAVGDFIRSFKAFAANFAKSVFYRVLGLISNVCNYFRSLMEISEKTWEGKAGLVLGWSFTALGAAVGAAAATVELGWASGAAFGISMGALGWTIVGAILLAIGALLLWLFYETPLEEWLKECTWGIRAAGKSVAEQLKSLINLLADPKIEMTILGNSFGDGFWISPQTMQLSISPGLFFKDISTYEVDMHLESHSEKLFGDNIVFHSQKGVLFPDIKQDKITLRKDETVEKIVREWKWNDVYDREEQHKLPVGDVCLLSFDLTIRVNISGDPECEKPVYHKKGRIKFPQAEGNK